MKRFKPIVRGTRVMLKRDSGIKLPVQVVAPDQVLVGGGTDGSFKPLEPTNIFNELSNNEKAQLHALLS